MAKEKTEATATEEPVAKTRTLCDHCISTGMSKVAATSFLEALSAENRDTLTKAAAEGSFNAALITIRNKSARATAVQQGREARQTEKNA